MRIEVEKLPERGEESFAHTYKAGELTLDEEGVSLSGAATVEGRASRKGEQVRLRGRVEAALDAPCDRCLRPVSLPVAADFEYDFVPAPEADATAGEASELLPEDMDFSVYEGDSVDVDEVVREQLLLALPTRLLCREDCKGLCPDCGADLNEAACACEQKQIDPRWAGLAALKDSKS